MFKHGFQAPYGLGCMQVLRKGEEGFKFPMLIVGSNNYIRTKVYAPILQAFDVHLFFMPNNENTWHVGTCLYSRQGNYFPLFFENMHTDITQALEGLFKQANTALDVQLRDIPAVQALWITHSIYRCPKIALKDVLSLEPYQKSA